MKHRLKQRQQLQIYLCETHPVVVVFVVSVSVVGFAGRGGDFGDAERRSTFSACCR